MRKTKENLDQEYYLRRIVFSASEQAIINKQNVQETENKLQFPSNIKIKEISLGMSSNDNILSSPFSNKRIIVRKTPGIWKGKIKIVPVEEKYILEWQAFFNITNNGKKPFTFPTNIFLRNGEITTKKIARDCLTILNSPEENHLNNMVKKSFESIQIASLFNPPTFQEGSIIEILSEMKMITKITYIGKRLFPNKKTYLFNIKVFPNFTEETLKEIKLNSSWDNARRRIYPGFLKKKFLLTNEKNFLNLEEIKRNGMVIEFTEI